jgi:hypothetical protein
MTKQFNDDGIPFPDPELMKKWHEAALRDLPSPQDVADLIVSLRWAAELDRIGAANKELPDRLTSIEYMLRSLRACLSTVPVLMEDGALAPLARLHTEIVDLAKGHKSKLFVPITTKPGNQGKGTAQDCIQGMAARALSEFIDAGEPAKQSADRIAQALRKGRRDMRDITGDTVKNWRARLNEGPGARGVSQDALNHYLAPLDIGSTPKARGEALIKAFRHRGEAIG